MTNTLSHVKDDAIYVKIRGDKIIKNVQELYEALGEYSFSRTGLPLSSETDLGISRLATLKEVIDGTGQGVVTADKLSVRLTHPEASEVILGLTRYSTNDQSITGIDTVALTPKNINYIFDKKVSTEAKHGTIRISTEAQAKAGVDNTTAMSPAKVKLAIQSMVPGYGSATESVAGLVQLATTAQVRQGKLREGFAISPYTFATLSGSEAEPGIYRIAKQAEVNAGSLDNVVITPKKLVSYTQGYVSGLKGTSSALGMVKITETIGLNQENTALSSKAPVMPRAGGNFTGRIYNSTTTEPNKYLTKAEIENLIRSMSSDIPVGTIVMRYAYANTGDWIVCDGRQLAKASYPELFAAIGNSVSATHFALPDLRNMFPRGANGSSRQVGLRESDMIRRHKHVMPWGEFAKSSVVSPWGGTNNRWRYGSNRSDNDNYWYHTNDGSDYDGVVNPAGVIGHETRPVNVAVAFLIKVR